MSFVMPSSNVKLISGRSAVVFLLPEVGGWLWQRHKQHARLISGITTNALGIRNVRRVVVCIMVEALLRLGVQK